MSFLEFLNQLWEIAAYMIGAIFLGSVMMILVIQARTFYGWFIDWLDRYGYKDEEDE